MLSLFLITMFLITSIREFSGDFSHTLRSGDSNLAFSSDTLSCHSPPPLLSALGHHLDFPTSGTQDTGPHIDFGTQAVPFFPMETLWLSLESPASVMG
jgi:hypothetical protein